MIDLASGRIEPVLDEYIHSARRAAFFVAVRGVDHNRQIKVFGEVDLGAQIFVFERALVVVANLANSDDTLLAGKRGEYVHHRFGQRFVVGFLRVESNRAIVPDAELAGAKPLEPDDVGEIIGVAADIRARLTKPEGRLDYSYDAA
jgi:hypothetical protein